MTIYDPACGSGGMLTELQNHAIDPDGSIKATGDVYLYGKEINDETYAICKSDMMIKGNNPENIKVGSTLRPTNLPPSASTSCCPLAARKSWNSELKYIKDGNDVIDSRFKVPLANYWGNVDVQDATPRSSDGQSLLFLMEMVGKMQFTKDSAVGVRIASVHNGSSLFTGDAGSGELNIRRHIIENDLLDTIIQLAEQPVLQHRHHHLHLAADQRQTRRPARLRAVDRRQPAVPQAAQEPWRQELRIRP